MNKFRIFIGVLISLLFSTQGLYSQLKDVYYPRHAIPEVIQNKIQQRDAAYLDTLSRRKNNRYNRLRKILQDQTYEEVEVLNEYYQYLGKLRHQLLLSLGFYEVASVPQLQSSHSWTWKKPWQTHYIELQGEQVPRTIGGDKGVFEEISLTSPTGGEISALFVKTNQLSKPYLTVICIPPMDTTTRLAMRKESFISDPLIKKMINANLLVVSVDLPSLTEISDHAIKKGLILGKPLLGQMTAEISYLVSYLITREEIQTNRIAIYGQGLGGFAAALASAVDPRIFTTVVEDGLPSFQTIIQQGESLEGEWLLPKFLSYADGGDLISLIAPRPLCILVSDTSKQAWSGGLQSAKRIAGITYPFFNSTNFHDIALEDSRLVREDQIIRFLCNAMDMPVKPWENRLLPITEMPSEFKKNNFFSITDISTLPEWRKRKQQILQDMEQLLGGFPDRGNSHSGEVIESGEEKGFTWERLLVKTTPQTIMPVLITKNNAVSSPAPAIIHISGYSISYEQDALRIAKEMADHGFIGVFPSLKTAVGFRLGGTPRDAIGILEGRLLLGEWAWNLMGLVDYLNTRSDIQSEHIGAMGWSMGATIITYFMPFDSRIKAGAGFVAFNQMKGLMKSIRTETVTNGDYTSYLENNPLYNFVPGILNYCDVDDFLATMAPRPLLSLAAIEDQYVPYRVVQDIYDRQSHIYGLLQIPEHLQLYIYPGPHDLAEPLRIRAWEFFNRWLK